MSVHAALKAEVALLLVARGAAGVDARAQAVGSARRAERTVKVEALGAAVGAGRLASCAAGVWRGQMSPSKWVTPSAEIL